MRSEMCLTTDGERGVAGYLMMGLITHLKLGRLAFAQLGRMGAALVEVTAAWR